MSRIVRLASLLVLPALLVAGAVLYSRAATGASANPDAQVILLRCSVGGTDFRVSLYQGSPSSPASRDPLCAANIALLIQEGFEIRDVGHYDETETPFAIVTLAR
jgi:hypothetical protein